LIDCFESYSDGSDGEVAKEPSDKKDMNVQQQQAPDLDSRVAYPRPRPRL